MKRISFQSIDSKQVFSVAIKSLKHDRAYILGLFVMYPQATHLALNGRMYTAADIYRHGGNH